MNSRWATFFAASLVAFASFVITWQIKHYGFFSGYAGLQGELPASLVQSLLRGKRLAGITGIVPRNHEPVQLSEKALYYDLVLPENARIFMTNMTGPTNYSRILYYYYLTYYLFPREVGTSLDHVTRITCDGLQGRASESDQEILANGFDVRMDISPAGLNVTALRNIPVRFPANPVWFDSGYDTATAFLLPLLTALAGMWLFRFLFSTLSRQMLLPEQLACGMGLGMMAVAAVTLGIKLCGFHGYHLVFFAAGGAGIAEIWNNRKTYKTAVTDGCLKMAHSPVTVAIMVIGLLVFLILFRLAGLQGVTEYDGVMAWLLKAKIFHLHAGSEIVQWFSNPRLAHAHLDYPTLVPSLHAATFDSLGHVDEYVTKFWPTWMLFFLLTALASMNRAGDSWRHVLSFTLLGLLLMPVTQAYVQMEGGTMPMIFFTVLGFIQCSFWLIGKNRARLDLGLTLLWGAAMAKFEGFIFLALVGGWMLLLPSARPSLKPAPHFWRVPVFWLFAVLPFICLRVQIPVLHFESGWVGYALHNPGITLLNSPWIFMILFARFFVSTDFASWSGEEGRLHWIGKWDGLTSLYNHSTLGLAWLCLVLTVVLWIAVPARRLIILWVLMMLIGTLAVFSVVFASFLNITNLVTELGYAAGPHSGRYLLPILLAWFSTIMTMFFSDLLSSPSTLVPNHIATESPASVPAPSQGLPVLKNGHRLAMGAFLVILLGVFAWPENNSALPAESIADAAAINSLDHSETNAPEDADVQARMVVAMQMDMAGKCAEALQTYREAARLHPTHPVALNKLAWSLAMNPVKELRNGKEAVRLASQAVELTGRQQPMYIKTLAAAYAEDGQLSKAVEVAQKALALAVLKDQPNEGVAISHLLELFSTDKTIGVTNGP
jgi:hypothetical protein